MTDHDTSAPERVWMDPDIQFPECEKQYGCDVEYIRADIHDAVTAERDALAARVAAMEAERDDAVTALMSLERRATRVSDCGASPGPQWTQLTIGLLAARTVLRKMPAPAEPARAALTPEADT